MNQGVPISQIGPKAAYPLMVPTERPASELVEATAACSHPSYLLFFPQPRAFLRRDGALATAVSIACRLGMPDRPGRIAPLLGAPEGG